MAWWDVAPKNIAMQSENDGSILSLKLWFETIGNCHHQQRRTRFSFRLKKWSAKEISSSGSKLERQTSGVPETALAETTCGI